MEWQGPPSRIHGFRLHHNLISTGIGDFALARYHADSTLDTIFGGSGKVITDSEGYGLGAGVNIVARDLVMQPRDGRLVVVGAAYEGSPDHSPGPPTWFLAHHHAIICNGVVVTRVGTTGNDTIMGTSGNDVISGFGGNDLISGLGGNDILCGGSGHDTLRGGSGNDFLDGDAGTDKCNGGSGSSDQAVACEHQSTRQSAGEKRSWPAHGDVPRGLPMGSRAST